MDSNLIVVEVDAGDIAAGQRWNLFLNPVSLATTRAVKNRWDVIVGGGSLVLACLGTSDAAETVVFYYDEGSPIAGCLANWDRYGGMTQGLRFTLDLDNDTIIYEDE